MAYVIPDDATRVFFVRHGVTEQTGKVIYGHTPGLHLSDEGNQQAKYLAEYMSSLELNAIYSSPLERARETAGAIADSRGLEIIIRDELIDTDVGAWTNYTLEQCAQLPEWESVIQKPSGFTFPDGESFVGVRNRMEKAVSSLVGQHKGEKIVVACHRDPIILLLAHYLSIDPDLFQSVPCKPASVSEVIFSDGNVRVESINVLPAQRMV